MLVFSLISLLIAIPLFSSNISPLQLSRLTSITFLFAAFLSFNVYYIEILSSGLSLYSGLFNISSISLGIEVFILIIGAIILLPWNSGSLYLKEVGNVQDTNTYFLPTMFISPIISEYSMIILFTTIGALFLISSSDLVSIYLAIELQSFAVYILSSLYRNSESATAAGLKYFLLGALSSAFILLGSSLIYSYTGLTQLDSISSLLSVNSPEFTSPIFLGLIIMTVGFLFKVASAPFHNWAPDVYDGVPTIVTTWISIMPKISIFVLLINLNALTDNLVLSVFGMNFQLWQGLLLLCSLLSLIIGTVVGLAQYRIKRLLAYSTISHVGFMLLALSISLPSSIDALLFYIIQYSLTSLNMFFILLAFGYTMKKETTGNSDISSISELAGQFHIKPLLSLSMAICLFSMAGIPPLIGFFGKYAVLYEAIHNGYYFLALVGILTSVISAAYYLRIIRVLYFNNTPVLDNKESASVTLSSFHTYVISALTLFIVLFVLQPSLLLNSTQLMATSFLS